MNYYVLLLGEFGVLYDLEVFTGVTIWLPIWNHIRSMGGIPCGTGRVMGCSSCDVIGAWLASKLR